MTNYELLKEQLTIDDLADILIRYDLKTECYYSFINELYLDRKSAYLANKAWLLSEIT